MSETKLPLSRKITYSAIVSVWVLGFAFIFLEIAFRVFVPNSLKGYDSLKRGYKKRDAGYLSRWVRSQDSVLIYENRPNHTAENGLFTGEHGIVGKLKATIKKGKNIIRILILGDSIGNAGLDPETDKDVPMEQLYPYVLEKLLNDTVLVKDKTFEILNFSTNGYGTMQEARLLELKAGQFEPDLILWQYCLNDPLNSYTPTMFFLKINITKSYVVEFFKNLDFLKDDYSVDNYSPVPTQGPFCGIKRMERYWRWFNSAESSAWKKVAQGYSIGASYAQARNIPVLQVIFPIYPEKKDWNEGFFRQMHALAGKTAQQNGFQSLDLLPSFSRYPKGEMFLTRDIFHPTGKGHAVAARAIYDYIRMNLVQNFR